MLLLSRLGPGVLRSGLFSTCSLWVIYFGCFGIFEESPQLSTSGSARLLVTIQSNKLLLLAGVGGVSGSVRKRQEASGSVRKRQEASSGSHRGPL